MNVLGRSGAGPGAVPSQLPVSSFVIASKGAGEKKMEQDDAYEPPALEEIGGFTELTMAFGPCVENDFVWGTAWIC